MTPGLYKFFIGLSGLSGLLASQISLFWPCDMIGLDGKTTRPVFGELSLRARFARSKTHTTLPLLSVLGGEQHCRCPLFEAGRGGGTKAPLIQLVMTMRGEERSGRTPALWPAGDWYVTCDVRNKKRVTWSVWFECQDYSLPIGVLNQSNHWARWNTCVFSLHSFITIFIITLLPTFTSFSGIRLSAHTARYSFTSFCSFWTFYPFIRLLRIHH